MKSLVETLQVMKRAYEDAIRGGEHTDSSLRLIRSKKLIEMLHEFATRELTRIGIPPQWVHKDKPIYGYPKAKTQDIMIQPPQNSGRDLSVGPLMTINLRSQLSSIEKNYDTLFERLVAEALNLHNRFPYLVLGYIYLLPKTGYDDKAAKEKEVRFTERYDMEKYIQSFLSITNRNDPDDVRWKYERVCLLIVDFDQDPPIVMDDIRMFVQQGLAKKNFANLLNFETLSSRNFFDELYKTMTKRYYLLRFT